MRCVLSDDVPSLAAHVKRVTPAKLIAASNALIALSDCDDWEDITAAVWSEDETRADLLPDRLQLAIMSNQISHMLESFE